MSLPKLPNPQQQLWDDYLAVEQRGKRSQKIESLRTFIGRLLDLPDDLWKKWALRFVEQKVDAGVDLPVRQPLFEDILFPPLLDGLDRGFPSCGRWLAGLSSHLYQCQRCINQLGDHGASEDSLLRLATQDPNDHQSRQRLIDLLVSRLRYSLHELPAGVLYGTDGATPVECDKLMEELHELRELLRLQGGAADHAELIDACALHFPLYKRYLTERLPQHSYRDFIAAAPPKVVDDDA